MTKKQSGLVAETMPAESLPGQETSPPANGDTPPKPEETKAQRFSRLVNQRLQKAEQYLRLLGNLGNAKVYEYTTDQRDAVQQRISEAAAAAYNAFEPDAQAKRTSYVPI